MKTRLFFLGACALLLASCSNETDVYDAASPKAISFSALSQKQSRSAFSDAAIPGNTTIYVGAFTKTATQYVAYLSNAAFTCNNPTADDNSRLWTAMYNWPATGDVDFLCYTCDQSTDAVSPTSAVWTPNVAGKYIQSMTLTFGTSLQGQTDVCYSNVFNAQHGVNGFAPPKFIFNHALSWIVANFVQSSSLGNDEMKVRKVRLNNVYLSGDFTYSTADGSTYTAAWTPQGTRASKLFPAYESAGSDGLTYGDAKSAETKGILVLPGDEQTISFDYCTKNGTDISGNPTYTDWIEYTTTLSPGVVWKGGYKYVYNFTVVGNKITFTTGVTSYTDDSPGTSTIQ